MNSSVLEDGRKRKLPLWMMGVAAADKVSKSSDGDSTDVVTEEEVGIVSQRNHTKRKVRSVCHEKEVCVPVKEGFLVEESSFLVKCGTKKRRGVSRKDCEASEKKKCGQARRKVEAPVISKRKKAKSFGFESSDDIEASSPSEDNDDLTMDDLMSIAKEFVENDNDEGQHQPSDGAIRAENQSADDAISKSEREGCITAPPDIRRSPIHEAASSHHSSAENVTSKVITNKSSMTGDPTQDMLDLFLGPLLKKPAGEEKKMSLISRDITVSHEVKKHSRSVVTGNAPGPLAKKKSSLKDRVAMFLD